MLQRYVEDQFDYWARCKRAAILGGWTAGVPVAELEQTFTATPFQGKIGYGDIRKFADATRFHLRSAFHIAAALFPDYGRHGERIDALSKQLEIGLTDEALELLGLPLQMERADYMALSNAGCKSVSDVWKLNDNQIIECLGKRQGNALVKRRPST